MWSMPRSVLRVVAVIIGLCAVSGFVLGVRGAPEKARLPGEGPAGAAPGIQLQATDAKPLGDEALAPPPPVVEKSEAEKKPEEKAPAADPLDLAADQTPPAVVATVTPSKPSAPKPATPPATEDRVGDLLDGITPADDPPH